MSDDGTVDPVVITVDSDTGGLRKDHRKYIGERQQKAVESNRPYVLAVIPDKYGKVSCHLEPMDRRFLASGIDKLERIYKEYKDQLQDDPDYKSYPKFSGATSHEWVHVTEVMQPYAEELADEFAEVAADLSNTTTQRVPVGKSRFGR
jgi:hypothetical protein